MNNEKKLDMSDLIEKGKQGALSNTDIEEALEELDYDMDQIDKFYETLESNGIAVPGYMDTTGFEELENEVEQYESAEDMEKMLAQEGLAIDEPGAHVSEGDWQGAAA